jgi:hypothetical protein
VREDHVQELVDAGAPRQPPASRHDGGGDRDERDGEEHGVSHVLVVRPRRAARKEP